MIAYYSVILKFMKFILGKKEQMVSFFTPEGKVVPGTMISAGPVTVTQIKTKATDGYSALQVGYDAQKEQRLSKAVRGHLKDNGFFKYIKEFRAKLGEDLSSFAVGQKLDVSSLEVGDTITVSGTSKGKGFQGVVKRHGFHGGPRTHGQKHSEREAGSIGGGGGRAGGRVAKGMRMAGRMGSDTVSVKNLKVLAVDLENNSILVKGAVPGRRGTLLSIKVQN